MPPAAVPETPDSMPDFPLHRPGARRRAFAIALGAFVCAAGLPGTALAQWPPPSVNVPVCTATGAQSYRTAISDGAGGMFVAWTDTRFIVSDVYVQHIGASGAVLWHLDGVLVSGAANRQDQAVLGRDGNGGVYVAWRDCRADLEGDIYAQHVDANGSPRWVSNGVPVCVATGQQALPVMTLDRTDGFVLAWEDYRAQPCVYVQRVDTSGVALWGVNGVPVSTSFSAQYEPSIVAAGPTSTIVGWSQQEADGYEIFAQDLGDQGQPLWNASGLAVCVASGDQFHPIAVSDKAAGAWIVWEDGRNASIGVYASHVTWYGMPVTGLDGKQVCAVAADQLAAAAVADSRGGIVVAWQDARVNEEIYAQRLSPSGLRLWRGTGLPVCTTTGIHAFPSVAPDGRGGALFAWEDGRSSAGTDIFAQRIDSVGTAVWAVDGVGVCTASASQFQATVVSSPDSAGVVVWSDLRGSSDLYCERAPWLAAAPPALASLSAAPNPARDQASFAFALGGAGRAELTIYDAAGRHIRTLAHQALEAGAHELPWDARDESGRVCAEGVYFARLTVNGRAYATRSITIMR